MQEQYSYYIDSLMAILRNNLTMYNHLDNNIDKVIYLSVSKILWL